MNSMKKNRKKMTLICLLCFSFLLTGCKIGNKEVIVSNTLNNRQVFRIGNVSCGLKEAKVYLVNYQNIYGTAYGLNLWQHDFGDSSLENYVKNITMQELAQVVCLDQLAKEKEMELSEEEKEQAKKDMGNMLDYIDMLNELDTEGVEPMSHVFPVHNVFREDVVVNGDEHEKTLANAPAKKDNAFKVPKTVE